MEYTPDKLALSQLLLDSNNYRFFDMDQYTPVAQNRLHETSVQQRAEDLIRLDGKEELRALKESIETNGYVPVEILVVEPDQYTKDLYVVVEGNRRVAAMHWLKKDREGGSPIPQDLINTFDTLPATWVESLALV
ncbi:MAG TPA: ParB/Srx family N-terminal domain-containing protein [Syntrophorhabdales bacterium]|nr:ParB/Srx family N-terminal domain-containing protein [Syntrophorhabdales bacterium]